MSDEELRFIRKNGKVIPIRQKKGESNQKQQQQKQTGGLKRPKTTLVVSSLTTLAGINIARGGMYLKNPIAMGIGAGIGVAGALGLNKYLKHHRLKKRKKTEASRVEKSQHQKKLIREYYNDMTPEEWEHHRKVRAKYPD